MIKYTVKKIESVIGRDFIVANHYTKGCHQSPNCWGLFDENELIGVIAFATPGAENVRTFIFGPEYKDSVTELHRLFINDGTPKNTESWFISRSLKGLKKERPHLKAVISFADSTENHFGTIYQATNALYCGKTQAKYFYRDQSGRLRHPRQSGINISKDEALSRGWTIEKRSFKYRYIFLLGTSREKRNSLKMFRPKIYEKYPKELR